MTLFTRLPALIAVLLCALGGIASVGGLSGLLDISPRSSSEKLVAAIALLALGLAALVAAGLLAISVCERREE